MLVRRQVARRILQDDISADTTVWTVGVKTYAFAHQLSAILEPRNLVIEPFVC